MAVFRRNRAHRQLTESLGQLRAELLEVRGEVRELEAGLEEARKISRALWELLRQESELPDDALVRRLETLDSEDSSVFGKPERVPWVCPECERTNPPLRDSCLYCGCPT